MIMNELCTNFYLYSVHFPFWDYGCRQNVSIPNKKGNSECLDRDRMSQFPSNKETPNVVKLRQI